MGNQAKAVFQPDPRRWKALALLCLANFMVIMDTSIIGVALPAIKEALGYTQASLQWVFNAYVIFFGGLLLLGGRLSDLFGQRRMFMWGFSILTLASLLAGVAWNEESLNVGRALQGIGSAFIAPAALTIVMMLFGSNPKELGKAFGFWGASAAAGGTAGVFLGGVITEWLSWHWTFLINIPVGLLVLLVSPSLLSKGMARKGSVDLLGALSVTAALVLAVYGIVTAEHNGWSSNPTIWTLISAAVLFVLFLVVQALKKEPLVPLRIFSAPNLAAGNIALIMLSAAWIPLWFFLNLYLQQILQFNAFAGGLGLLPMTILIMVFMVLITGKMIGKFGVKANLVIGLIALGGSLLIFAENTPVDGNFVTNVLPASLLGALGMSLAYIPATMSAMSGAKPEEAGLASGIANTSYQIGSAIGLAAMVAIAAATTGSLTSMEQTDALNEGFHQAFFWSGIVAFVGALLALVFIRPARNGDPNRPAAL
ncbi:MFS transporter [Brevibacillus agri]|uniref:MFS transporter n=1 Tax=Brevibacillus agri TaxID=51101 RepID=UPI002E20D09C|nr:MFS transporter [Brevibacillus agri]MED1657588.1 MFS transporter [Brevibacillus agri]MED1690080.1 MFS transporter [Brevibacillus agri]MED1694003.1 MFS transporter [Brevibacillus agri]MED1699910.1 MFS transporter [Brevibacillus agri]